MRLYPRGGFRCLDHFRRRPCGWIGIWGVRGANGHAGRIGSTRAIGLLRHWTCHSAERVRIRRAVFRTLGTGGQRSGTDSRWFGRCGIGGHSVGASRGRRGLCHCERAEAGISPITGRGTHIRQSPDSVWRRDPRSYKWRRHRCGAEQPHRRGLHRRESVLPQARRSVRGIGQAGHLERGRDGGCTSGCGLRHPGIRCSEKNRSGVGGKSPAGRHGTPFVGRTENNHPQQVAARRSRSRAELHARRPAHRKDRRNDATDPERQVATGPHLFGNGWSGWDRMRRSRLAGGSRCGRNSTKRAPGTGPRG